MNQYTRSMMLGLVPKSYPGNFLVRQLLPCLTTSQSILWCRINLWGYTLANLANTFSQAKGGEDRPLVGGPRTKCCEALTWF